MIIAKLQGGTGNQLFQWAVSKNLSLIYETNYYFDMGYFSNKSNGVVTKWEYELDKFKNITSNPYNNQSLIPLTTINDNFHFKKLPNNSYLNGYWQSEKYFEENKNEIRKDLEISKELKDYIIEKYPLLNENTVSVHIRRGDYVNITHIHPLQTINYYKNAYDVINDSSINVLVFSDDISWCKENIKFKNINYIINENNITDMYIMSLCDHNIIANSSFSWWGGWLNSNTNKKIVAPLNWFSKKCNSSSDDIIPEKWIKI